MNVKDMDRIKEICTKLDAKAYGKECNFLTDDMEFYSRDYCRNISFRELIKWYLSNIDLIDEDYETNEEVQNEINNRQELLLKLIDIYSVHKVLTYLVKENIDI